MHNCRRRNAIYECEKKKRGRNERCVVIEINESRRGFPLILRDNFVRGIWVTFARILSSVTKDDTTERSVSFEKLEGYRLLLK